MGVVLSSFGSATRLSHKGKRAGWSPLPMDRRGAGWPRGAGRSGPERAGERAAGNEMNIPVQQ
jgi:hypothetical protein